VYLHVRWWGQVIVVCVDPWSPFGGRGCAGSGLSAHKLRTFLHHDATLFPGTCPHCRCYAGSNLFTSPFLYLKVCVSLCTGLHLAGYVWTENIENSVLALASKLCLEIFGWSWPVLIFQGVNCVIDLRHIALYCVFGIGSQLCDYMLFWGFFCVILNCYIVQIHVLLYCIVLCPSPSPNLVQKAVPPCVK
jgi:hypothetical protein